MKYGEKEILEAKLEPWPNPYPERNYTIDITFPEFFLSLSKVRISRLCNNKIIYIPDQYIVELKSLKLYLNKYRNQYISHEEATNKIYEDLYNLLKPRKLEVIGDWNPRGNVKTIIKVSSEDNK